VFSNGVIQTLIMNGRGYVPPQIFQPLFVDVRDVAQAHLKALELPKVASGRDIESKRFLIGGGSFTRVDAVQHLHQTRPELRARIGTPVGVEDPKGPISKINTQRAKEVLGFETFIGWKKCVEDTVDSLLEVEKLEEESL
jgi:nucleoside-diphosphate-sugar epimerase